MAEFEAIEANIISTTAASYSTYYNCVCVRVSLTSDLLVVILGSKPSESLVAWMSELKGRVQPPLYLIDTAYTHTKHVIGPTQYTCNSRIPKKIIGHMQ